METAKIMNIKSRQRSYRERLVPWSEFEAILSRLRQASGGSNDDVCKAMGYAGASMLSEWQKRGAPYLAKMAARGLLADLDVPPPKAEPERQFTFDELALIFSMSLTHDALPQKRAALQVKIANEMQKYKQT